eukprot:UN34564
MNMLNTILDNCANRISTFERTHSYHGPANIENNVIPFDKLVLNKLHSLRLLSQDPWSINMLKNHSHRIKKLIFSTKDSVKNIDLSLYEFPNLESLSICWYKQTLDFKKMPRVVNLIIERAIPKLKNLEYAQLETFESHCLGDSDELAALLTSLFHTNIIGMQIWKFSPDLLTSRYHQLRSRDTTKGKLEMIEWAGSDTNFLDWIISKNSTTMKTLFLFDDESLTKSFLNHCFKIAPELNTVAILNIETYPVSLIDIFRNCEYKVANVIIGIESFRDKHYLMSDLMNVLETYESSKLPRFNSQQTKNIPN